METLPQTTNGQFKTIEFLMGTYAIVDTTTTPNTTIEQFITLEKAQQLINKLN